MRPCAFIQMLYNLSGRALHTLKENFFAVTFCKEVLRIGKDSLTKFHETKKLKYPGLLAANEQLKN